MKCSACGNEIAGPIIQVQPGKYLCAECHGGPTQSTVIVGFTSQQVGESPSVDLGMNASPSQPGLRSQ